MVFSACVLQLVPWALITIIQYFDINSLCMHVKWPRYKRTTDTCAVDIGQESKDAEIRLVFSWVDHALYQYRISLSLPY